VERATRHFAGKHALITGGSGGIGLAIARRLVDIGAGVTLVARRPEPLHSAAAALSARLNSASVRTLALDVSDEGSVAESVPRELAEQPIDAVINAAGISHPVMFLDATPEDLREQMDVNYWGTVWVTRAALPHLLERGGGNVVIMGSISGRIGAHGYAGYSASKAALFGFAEVLRAELASRGVVVTIAMPSSTETAMLEHERESAPDPAKRLIKATRVISADKVAEAVVNASARGRFSVVPGLDARLQTAAYVAFPRIGHALLDRIARG
jgi:3-dehydrosphinganine reductase